MFLLSKLLPLLLLPLGGAEPPGSSMLLISSAFHMASGAWAGNPLADPLNWLPSAKGLNGSSRPLREAIGRTLYRAW